MQINYFRRPGIFRLPCQKTAELAKHVNKAKKCAKFHLFPDTNSDSSKTPKHGSTSHPHPFIPAPTGASHRVRQELETPSDVMDLGAGVAVPPSPDEIGLQNLKISIQNHGSSKRTVSAPGTKCYLPQVTPCQSDSPTPPQAIPLTRRMVRVGCQRVRNNHFTQKLYICIIKL